MSGIAKEPRSTTVPMALREKKQWLIWRYEPGEKKPRKMPYYVNGNRRTGKQGSDTDRDALATFEDAMMAVKPANMAGVGFAFLPGDGLIGIDIDNAIDLHTGEVAELLTWAIKSCASYAEFSPSRRGVHIIVRGETKSFKNNDIGLEVFCGRQFFTVTGDHWEGTPNDVTSITSAALAQLRARVDNAKRKSATTTIAQPPVSDDRAKLESALAYISAECGYDDWIKIGMAIHAALGEAGLPTWDYWSSKAGKYPGRTALEAHWNSFKPGGGVTAASLFKMATEGGWRPAQTRHGGAASQHSHQQQSEDGEQWHDLALPGAISTPRIPADLLPGIGGKMAAAVARSTQTPTAAAVMMVLSTYATIFQRRYEVAPYGDEYRETLSLWTLVALPSGARKSAIIGEVSAPLHRHEKLERDRLRGEIARNTSMRLVSKKRIESLTQSAAKTNDVTEREQLRAEIEAETLAMPDEIFSPRLTTSDVTPEFLQTMIARFGERMALFSDESGIFGILAGQYSGGNANIDAFLQGFSGSPFRVDRAGRDAYVDRPALTFGLMVQPGVLADVAGIKRFRDSGLLARFLFALPESTVGSRDVRDRAGIPAALREAWETLVFDTLPRGHLVAPGKPVTLALTDDAREHWLKFSERIERNQGDGGKFEAIADWTSKLPGTVARIATLLELAESRGEATQVGEACMLAAVRIGTLLIPHAQAAFRLLGADAVEDDARALLRWIEANRWTSFKRSVAQKALEGRFRTLKRLEDAAVRLAEWNAVSKVRMLKNPGARATPYYNVNPALFEDSSVSP